MNKDKMLPIQYNEWDQAGEEGDIQYYDAEFLEDFGPFKKGEVVRFLCLLVSQATLTEHVYDGNTTVEGRKCNVRIEVKP